MRPSPPRRGPSSHRPEPCRWEGPRAVAAAAAQIENYCEKFSKFPDLDMYMELLLAFLESPWRPLAGNFYNLWRSIFLAQ